MNINKGKVTQIILLLLSFLLIFYTYYYLPKQNQGQSKLKQKKKLKLVEEIKSKNTFKNTEYIDTDSEGKKYTTRAKESYILQNEPDLIYLNDVYSFTTLKKDNSLIEIRSKKALVNKKIKETTYENQVVITNKSYKITANIAKHLSQKNLIIIDGNVIMKDLTDGLSHVVYCDTVEIDTTTNNAVAFMKEKDKKVLAEKYK
jgi:hypothetical protein